jgi:hypothetical protein
MGRRSLLTPEAIEKYQQALAGAAWPEVAAQHAGWSARSYYRYLAGSSPASIALRAATEQAENQLEVRCGATVAKAAQTSPRWAMEILRRRFPQRWAAPPPASADTPTTGRPAADEVVVLDPAFVELIVPRLLAAGDRQGTDSAAESDGIAAFEDRSPRRGRLPEEGGQ